MSEDVVVSLGMLGGVVTYCFIVIARGKLLQRLEQRRPVQRPQVLEYEILQCQIEGHLHTCYGDYVACEVDTRRRMEDAFNEVC